MTKGNHSIKLEYVELTNDAMAYLNWYLCPGGKQDCSLSITPDYQTRYLDQPMAPSCAIDKNQTIAAYGCYITSISMALQKIGIDTNPKELNNWLSETDPVTNQPRGYYCDGTLRSIDVIEVFANEKYGKIIGWKLMQDGSLNDVIDVIRNKSLPVIMQGTGHFVLAVDVMSVDGITTLGINDPYHSFACGVQEATQSLPLNSELNCTEGQLSHATSLPEEITYNGSKNPKRVFSIIYKSSNA